MLDLQLKVKVRPAIHGLKPLFGVSTPFFVPARIAPGDFMQSMRLDPGRPRIPSER